MPVPLPLPPPEEEEGSPCCCCCCCCCGSCDGGGSRGTSRAWKSVTVAVRTAAGSVAACVKLMASGSLVVAVACTTVYVWKPDWSGLLVMVPGALPSTRSPFLNRVTSEPTASTTPATSVEIMGWCQPLCSPAILIDGSASQKVAKSRRRMRRRGRRRRRRVFLTHAEDHRIRNDVHAEELPLPVGRVHRNRIVPDQHLIRPGRGNLARLDDEAASGGRQHRGEVGSRSRHGGLRARMC
ncbi:hypothetical protein VTG60DRAFT_6230 [Thermothelomyces hinnuleus]